MACLVRVRAQASNEQWGNDAIDDFDHWVENFLSSSSHAQGNVDTGASVRSGSCREPGPVPSSTSSSETSVGVDVFGKKEKDQ